MVVKSNPNTKMSVEATAVAETPTPFCTPGKMRGRRVAFVGKLGASNRKEARKLVRDHEGLTVDDPSLANLIVIGADELPSNDYEQLLSDSLLQSAGLGSIKVINETKFWEMLEMAPSVEETSQLYTPAMLAELLEVSITTIRRWQRRGLIKPARQVKKLPYFDFEQVASARRIARLIESGKSPKHIEEKLSQLAELSPGLEQPLSQLSIIVEGRDILLRQGEGLIEPGGQIRIDFDAIEESEAELESEPVLNLAGNTELSLDSISQYSKPIEYITLANQFEDVGEPETAVEIYRAMSLAFGPTPETCFRIAELLYLMGQVPAARERYYMAVELDETYVEARASLGCVLAELGNLEMAVSAFRGALDAHPEYPDVHFYLARCLEDLGDSETATVHWKTFLELAPKSPWADEARERIGWDVERASFAEVKQSI